MWKMRPATARASAGRTAGPVFFSFQELVDGEAAGNEFAFIRAVDRYFEVMAFRLQPVRQERRIARRLLALDEALVDLVRGLLRHDVLHHDEMVELDRMVLLAPALARRFRIRNHRLEIGIGRHGGHDRGAELTRGENRAAFLSHLRPPPARRGLSIRPASPPPGVPPVPLRMHTPGPSPGLP